MKDYQQQVILKDLVQYSLVYLVPLADFHIGCRDVAIDAIRGYIEWIKNRNNAFTVLNGDMLNCATKDSSAELYDDLTTPDAAYAVARELLMPIKNRILMITRGNHEEAIYRKSGADYMARLAYDLGDIPYRPDGGMVGIRLSTDGGSHNIMCWVYATHGWGGARTIGAKVKKAQDLLPVANADIYVISHDHTQNINRGNILEPPRSRLRFVSSRGPCVVTIRRKLYINTGGFIGYGGYIQRKGYTPQDLGTPRVRIEAKRQGRSSDLKLDLHASI